MCAAHHLLGDRHLRGRGHDAVHGSARSRFFAMLLTMCTRNTQAVAAVHVFAVQAAYGGVGAPTVTWFLPSALTAGRLTAGGAGSGRAVHCAAMRST